MSSLVYLKSKDGSTVYVYSNEKDEDGVYRRRCIGHLDPVTGDIVPNRERSRSISPKVRSYGVNLLLRDISDSIGLTESLQITFKDTWDSILSGAFYCLTEDSPISEMEQWMDFNETPRMWPLNINQFNSIMRTISDDDIESFFKVWKKRAGDERFVITHASMDNSVEKKSKRDFEKLFSMEAEICYGDDTGLPIAYCLHAIPFRNMYELFDASDRFDWVNADNVSYVISSEQCESIGLESILPVSVRYTVSVPSVETFFKKKVSEYAGDFSYDRPHINTSIQRSGRRERFIHLYYNPSIAELETARFLNIINKCRLELEQRRYVMSHAPIYNNYFLNLGGGHIDLNSERIMQNNAMAGFRIYISNHISSSTEAIGWYRRNEKANRLLDKMNNDTDLAILKLYQQPSVKPRIFVQFIALILNNALESRMIESGLADETVHSILYSMKRMLRVDVGNRKNPMMTEMDPLQEKVVDSMIVHGKRRRK